MQTHRVKINYNQHFKDFFMVKVTNKSSPFFNKDVTIQEHLENEMLSVFIPEDEIIVTIHSDDVSLSSQVKLPRSRKDFYIYIQNERNSKKDIMLTIKGLIESNRIKLNNITLNEFNLLIEESISRKDVVETIRTQRDLNQIEFLLPNA